MTSALTALNLEENRDGSGKEDSDGLDQGNVSVHDFWRGVIRFGDDYISEVDTAHVRSGRAGPGIFWSGRKHLVCIWGHVCFRLEMAI